MRPLLTSVAALCFILALQLRLAACADCTGPTVPAKIRYIFIAGVKDDKPADVTAMADAYGRWIKSCDGLVVREGHAPAISKDPRQFGFSSSLPNGSFMGDFGAWSDWRSLEDLRACITKGLSDGNVTVVRSYAVRAARIVVNLNTSNGLVVVPKAGRQDCSPTSFAPAKYRYMISYVLKDPTRRTDAGVLHHAINAANPVKPIRYGWGGKAALGKEAYVWGPGITKTADLGAWTDFIAASEVASYLTPPPPAQELLVKLRGMSAGAMRVIIPL